MYYGGENFVYTTAGQNFRSRRYDNYTIGGKIFVSTAEVQNGNVTSSIRTIPPTELLAY